jgi:hypothetical protein
VADTTTIVAVAGLAAALVSLGWQFDTRRASREKTRARRELAGKMTEGHQVAREIAAGRPDRDFSEERGRVEAWTREVLDLLDRYCPEEKSILVDGSGMTLFASQYGDKSRLENMMKVRLTRLREIIGRLR